MQIFPSERANQPSSPDSHPSLHHKPKFRPSLHPRPITIVCSFLNVPIATARCSFCFPCLLSLCPRVHPGSVFSFSFSFFAHHPWLLIKYTDILPVKATNTYSPLARSRYSRRPLIQLKPSITFTYIAFSTLTFCIRNTTVVHTYILILTYSQSNQVNITYISNNESHSFVFFPSFKCAFSNPPHSLPDFIMVLSSLRSLGRVLCNLGPTNTRVLSCSSPAQISNFRFHSFFHLP